jgi:Pentapeptide repeats (8 copies)
VSDEQQQHEQVQVAQPVQPKNDAWGAPISSISPERQAELRALADRQREWAAQDTPDREQSAFYLVPLTGAEVFYLAAYTLAGPGSTREDIEQQAARLRIQDSTERLHVDLDLSALHLEGANLSGATLSGANLGGATLSGANLSRATLTDADLSRATFDGKTSLASTILAAPRSWRDRLPFWLPGSRNTSVALGDIHWGGVGTVDLTAAEWGTVERLGDERGVGLFADAAQHEAVVRAYRQLAAQLRVQGMSEVADRFAYRAQIRQRGVLLRRFRLPQYLGSWFLAILAGYGYRPGRTIFWYLVVIASFAFAYYQATPGLPIGPLHFAQSSDIQPLPWNEALILSVSAFYGRGFFQPVKSLGDPVAGLAALEAVIGLVIEISFIATFTQRFVGAK